MNPEEIKSRRAELKMTQAELASDLHAALIIVSASGKENGGKENRGFVIFLSYIFLSAGLERMVID